MSRERRRGRRAEQPRTQQGTTLGQDIWYLLRKIIVIIVVIIVLFNTMFGVMRNQEYSMAPAMQEGDLVFYYRLDKRYVARDCLVYKYQGQEMVGRVIATPGDVVDITEDGLLINGNRQSEQHITEETLPYEGGITFPVTVPEGEVFILGDSRADATDSRVFGPVSIKKTLGKVMMFIRRRNM